MLRLPGHSGVLFFLPFLSLVIAPVSNRGGRKRDKTIRFKTVRISSWLTMERYMRSGHGFVLVYSITSRQSFEEISTFRRRILRAKDKDYFPMIVVGNHCNRQYERQVSRQEGAALAREFDCPFVEASSEGLINVDVAFYDLVRDIRKYERLERELNAPRTPIADYPVPPSKRSSTNRLLTPWLERLRR